MIYTSLILGRCNLDATTPCGAAALDPGKNRDMLMFLLHQYHLITLTGQRARSLVWPITFDSDTYTRARKLIRYVTERVPNNTPALDSMKLPDFSLFFLVPEFWHVGYTLMKHITFGPKLEKGAPEEDGKRFGWRNLIRPLLTILRKRGKILDRGLHDTLTSIGQPVPVNDKEMSIQKEKMGAEFKDLHLYLTYLLCAFQMWQNEFPMEYQEAVRLAHFKNVTNTTDTTTDTEPPTTTDTTTANSVDSSRDGPNCDVRCLLLFFRDTIPITVDFVEHAHFKNVKQLKYVLTRTIVLLHEQHRTGYRRCLMQFYKDLVAMPAG